MIAAYNEDRVEILQSGVPYQKVGAKKAEGWAAESNPLVYLCQHAKGSRQLVFCMPGGIMNFSFYTVSSEYCDFLRKTDLHVPYTKEEKSNRPFVGIVFSVNGFQYYAPLTSPKPKHLHMKNQIDFLKINEGKWGAVNFNNL